MKIIQINTL